jgi:hypothetical protein
MQVGTTPNLAFRALLGANGEAELDIVVYEREAREEADDERPR